MFWGYLCDGFLLFSESSYLPLATNLILVRDLEYANTQGANRLIQEVSKLLDAYLKNILTSDF